MSIKDIINGHLNEALGSNESLKDKRMAICKACPLLTTGKWGPMCNSSLYLNKETNETSEVPKAGYTKGCGCRLNAKTRLPDAECPLKKW